MHCAVRDLFVKLGFDWNRYGTAEWNPLGWLVMPGETVFIKPNMIAHKHSHCDDWDYVITHGSVIRAVVDYVYLALQGKGKIQIGDGPQTDSDFDQTVGRMGLREIQAYYRQKHNFEIEILDLRKEYWVQKSGVYVDTVPLPGDPQGSLVVNLGRDSMFAEQDGEKVEYYGAFYDVQETNAHHRNRRHEYMVSKSPIAADVFINIPKLKTHKKCGLTVNLKSLVGINANKNWLPHYVFGAPKHGGDQFAEESVVHRLENTLVRKAKTLLLRKNPLLQGIASRMKQSAYRTFGDNESVVRSGNWYGNDTVWRMCLDLNRILMYCNAEGEMTTTRKRFFSVVDGVVAMEGNGPVAGIRKEIGMLLAGTNPVAVDLACARLMGFDYRKLPILHRALELHPYALMDGQYEDIRCVSDCEGRNRRLVEWLRTDSILFKPHFGWTGHVELTD
jgi:uncharacterized protein (DUF362 family)